MTGRLIALDKLPGVRPVGIGEIWRRLLAKYMLKVTRPKATHAFKDDWICAGLKAVTDRAVHRVQYILDANPAKKNWDLLPVDSENSFNEINQIRML